MGHGRSLRIYILGLRCSLILPLLEVKVVEKLVCVPYLIGRVMQKNVGNVRRAGGFGTLKGSLM